MLIKKGTIYVFFYFALNNTFDLLPNFCFTPQKTSNLKDVSKIWPLRPNICIHFCLPVSRRVLLETLKLLLCCRLILVDRANRGVPPFISRGNAVIQLINRKMCDSPKRHSAHPYGVYVHAWLCVCACVIACWGITTMALSFGPADMAETCLGHRVSWHQR